MVYLIFAAMGYFFGAAIFLFYLGLSFYDDTEVVDEVDDE